METLIFHRRDCEKAPGVCVVIDVLRAFTTSAFAFAAGAVEIALVSSSEEAFALYERDPSLVLMGEEGGLPIGGFHYDNSPALMEPLDLREMRLVQRTSSGTQGVVACRYAERLLVTSFVVAEATLRHLRQMAPSQISFIVTGCHDGDEDLALAEYLQRRLSLDEVPLAPYLDRVASSLAGRRMSVAVDRPYLQCDVQFALQANRFSFAMEVVRRGELLVAQPTILGADDA